jgi:hypothetical protein
METISPQAAALIAEIEGVMVQHPTANPYEVASVSEYQSADIL